MEEIFTRGLIQVFFIWQILSTEIWFNVFIDKNIDQVNKNYKFE